MEETNKEKTKEEEKDVFTEAEKKLISDCDIIANAMSGKKDPDSLRILIIRK